MLMNNFEFMLMNNPVRGLVQEYIEAQQLRKLSTLPNGKVVLEIGCGNGHGTRLIKKYFHPKRIYAIDLDKKMIQIAKQKNTDTNITFEVGDAAKLKYKNNTFDAVFDFAIIHHIPNWKDCLVELKRVLKPNGQLIIEDLSVETFTTPFGTIMKRLLDHPYKKMYQRSEFISYLKQIGFKVIKKETHYPLGTIQYFHIIAVKTGL